MRKNPKRDSCVDYKLEFLAVQCLINALADKCLHISGEPPNAARGVAMEEKEAANGNLDRLCQGISRGVAACTYPATVRSPSCEKWFCDTHAEDEQWLPCMLSAPD